jgi:hypothetical protein
LIFSLSSDFNCLTTFSGIDFFNFWRKPTTPKFQLKWIHFMKRNLTGYQFGIYWTRLNVHKALSSSNGNVCITLSIQNIDYK